MKTEERLIVAADFDPRSVGGVGAAFDSLLSFADLISGLGVYIKINTVLRAFGYLLIDILHDKGLKVFADLKLIDIPNTMGTDGAFLSEYNPEILTVMCCAGVNGMQRVQDMLPNTEVLGVTVLTSLNDFDCMSIFTCSAMEGVLRFSEMAESAGLDGLILSPREAEVVKSRELMLSLNTPAIRPKWANVKGDDQSRTLTPYDAIKNGVDRIVIGRPILQARNPRDAVLQTLDEINSAL